MQLDLQTAAAQPSTSKSLQRGGSIDAVTVAAASSTVVTTDETDDEESTATAATACQDCGGRQRRRLEISYTIEDLDALAPEQRQQRVESVCNDGGKYKSFLSPDDALRDLRKYASQGAEIRWEMHTSRTDVDLASRAAGPARCNQCHGGSFTPGSETRRRRGGGEGERGDLRKHHSAEGDKWSLKPTAASEYDLRKHLSDDSRMHERTQQPRSTLQVPEVHANPKQRCVCARRTLSLSPSPSPDSRRPSPMLACRSSLTPELPPMRRRGGGGGGGGAGGGGGDSESMRKISRVSPVSAPPVQAEQEQQAPPKQASTEQQQQTKKMSKKERLAVAQQQQQLGEAKRAIRSKWAVKSHFSLPAEPPPRKGGDGGSKVKSKSLKERYKYSVRRSMSPEPDQILLRGTDNRVVRRLISAEVQLPAQDGGPGAAAKWAPYEGYSPLPAVGMKKGRRRESKKISDIQWEAPPDNAESPIRGGVFVQPPPPRPKLADLVGGRGGDDDGNNDMTMAAADGPEDFSNITPPHAPPPEASPPGGEDEQFRMRMLNQVSCFPIYQGAWREESPPPTPPPPDISTPIWSPKDASTVTAAQLRKQSVAAATSRYSPSPPALPSSPPPQRSKGRSSKKIATRAKSQESTRQQQRKQSAAEMLQPRSILSRGGGNDAAAAAESGGAGGGGRRSRPQLLRSTAFSLKVPPPHEQLAKRSLSEEVRSYNPRSESTRRGLVSRAKSEDASRRGRLWSPEDSDELREYVTTV